MRFEKDMTRVVKGFAIICMILVHCNNTNQYNFEVGTDYAPFFQARHVFHISRWLYGFLIGYGYAFARKKSLSYGYDHARRLVLKYWVFLFLLTVPLCLPAVAATGWERIAYNAFGVDPTYSPFNWYISFYILAMATMPLASRLIDRKPVIATIGLFAFCHAMVWAVNKYLPTEPFYNNGMWTKVAFQYFRTIPSLFLGYLFARERYYERIDVSRLPKVWAIVIGIAGIVLPLVARHFCHRFHGLPLDAIYSPIIIGSIVMIFNKFEWSKLRWLMYKLGSLSVYMWFCHGLFFTPDTKWFYQPAITALSHHINVITLTLIVITFFASWAISVAYEWVEARLKAMKT